MITVEIDVEFQRRQLMRFEVRDSDAPELVRQLRILAKGQMRDNEEAFQIVSIREVDTVTENALRLATDMLSKSVRPE